MVYINATLGQGVLGDAGSLFNDGTPITIDRAQILSSASALSYPSGVLEAQVVAHESGHKLGRPHPLRMNCCSHVNLALAQIQTLGFSQYARDSSNTHRLYFRSQTYNHAGSRRREDQPVPNLYQLGSNPFSASAIAIQPPTPNPNDAVYRLDATNPLNTSQTQLRVMNQLQRIMDWTPRLTLQNYQDWTFTTDDLKKMKAKH